MAAVEEQRPAILQRTADAVRAERRQGIPEPQSGQSLLESLHPGETVESVREATGFAFDVNGEVPATPDPSEAELALLRGTVCDEMVETYPDFCARIWGRRAQAA